MDQAREALRAQCPPMTTNSPRTSAPTSTAHEASGTTTSRLPGLPPGGRPLSRSQRDQLTGVPTDPSKQGWNSGISAPHLCQPPRQYPQNCGPGSTWMCRCGAVWSAAGIDLNPDGEGYGLSPDRNDTVLKVERWFYVRGGVAAVCLEQQDLYDWRPLGPYYVKLLRLLIDSAQNRQGDTKWQDLG
jgi:hypothetical protein